MKNQLLLLLTAMLLSCGVCLGQISIECKSWERCLLNGDFELVECGDDVVESSVFDINEAETMIIHTMSGTKTAYYVTKTVPDEDVISYYVKSDTGNDYALLVMPSEMEVYLMFIDDEDTYAIAFHVDKFYMEEPEEEQVDPKECYAKGDEYYDQKDYAEAVKWYRLAAEQGYAPAQNDLGYCYQKGYGVDQNYSQSIYWYRKAADQGYATGQSNLGYMYYYGYGVTTNYADAVYWFRKAADQGKPVAQNWMGFMYENGYGVTKSLFEAMKWYQKSADQGNESARESFNRLNGN